MREPVDKVVYTFSKQKKEELSDSINNPPGKPMDSNNQVKETLDGTNDQTKDDPPGRIKEGDKITDHNYNTSYKADDRYA